MEADAAVWVRTPRTVLEVSLDGEPDGLQLGSDLVVAPGLEDDFKEVVVRRCRDEGVAEAGELGAAAIL